MFSCNDQPGSGDVGSCSYGSNGSPNAIASVYYTGYAFLKNTANAMDRVKSGFTNVGVRMVNTASNTWGWDKVINITGTTRVEHGFATTMHEMGHVAQAMASRNRYLGPDSSNKGAGIVYNACGGNSTWAFDSSDECKNVILHEGAAESFAFMARMRGGSANPCTSRVSRAEECADGDSTFNLESNVCPSSGRAEARQVVRYFWDTFDSSGNTDKDNYDEAWYRFPNGRDNREKSEDWCCTFWTCSPCNPDQRQTNDFDYHLELVTGNDTTLLNTHCL